MLRREGGALILEGAVTLDTVPALAATARELWGQGVDVVDFGAVTGVDSAAVALALEWLREAHRTDGAVRFINLPASMRNLAELYGVSELLQSASA